MTQIAPIPLGGRSRLAGRRRVRQPEIRLGGRKLPVGTASVAMAALLALLAMGGSLAHSPQTGSWAVLALEQSNYTTEQSTFTVSVQVASPADVQSAAFSFCQLSSAVCYYPVAMTLHGTNWFEGTTQRMSTYSGMKVGVQAGYNISILYANNTTVHEPDLPNAFSTLTVGTEVGGEFMYEMTVGVQLYNLSGDLSDATTHAGLAGATVTLSPNGTSSVTSSTGAYSFTGLANGSYTLAVSEKGYPTSSATVTINGQDLVKDLAVSNSTGVVTPPVSHPSGKTGFGYLTTMPGIAVLAVALLAVVVAALVAFSMSRKRRRGGSASVPSEATEPAPSSPETPP